MNRKSCDYSLVGVMFCVLGLQLRGTPGGVCLGKIRFTLLLLFTQQIIDRDVSGEVMASLSGSSGNGMPAILPS